MEIDNSLYENLNESERQALEIILKEMKEKGTSSTYESLLYSQYEEIPVTFEEFVTNPEYIGNATGNGENIYPFWREQLRAIVNAGTKYNEIIFAGAIGLGKSWNACLLCAYYLYKLLCLKSPQAYYNQAPKEPISFAFLNIYKYVSEGVAYSKFQSMLLDSPWFLKHGHVEGVKHREFVPDKNITFIVGCNPDHIIGKNVMYCLTGDTEILTEQGYIKIEDLLTRKVKIYTQLDNGTIKLTDKEYNSILTKRADELIEIELENGSIIRCTPEHKIRLSDGSYKEAGQLTVDDDIMEIHIGYVLIKSIKRVSADENVYDIVNVEDTHNFIVKTGNRDVVVHNCVLDEISFNKASAATDLKKKIMDLYSNVRSRMWSRFSKEGVLHAQTFLISSKKSDSDFLDAYAETRKGEPETYIVDEPQWVVKPEGTFSKKTFRLAVGSKTRSSVILQDDDKTSDDDLIKMGYSKVLHPPESLKKEFEDNMDNALRDLAGVSTTIFSKFLPLNKIQACYSQQLVNPFENAELMLGLKDNIQLWEYFNMSVIPDWLKALPMYIHNDIAVSGDGYGLGCVACAGLKNKWNERLGQMTTDPVYIMVFGCRIKAKKGDQVSIEKVRNFIYWLKYDQGFNIQRVTADSYQSTDMLQNMQTRGIPSKMISLDRTPEGYITLRNAIFEKRVMLMKVPKLEDELSNLEQNQMTGKVDHPKESSKDLADGVCGALWSASMYQTEMPTIGKDLDHFFAANLPNTFDTEMESFHKQIVADSVRQIDGPKEEEKEENLFVIKDDDDIDSIILKVTGQYKKEGVKTEPEKKKDSLAALWGLDDTNTSQQDAEFIDKSLKEYYASMGILI